MPGVDVGRASGASLDASATRDAERVSDKGGGAFYSNTNFAALAMIVEAMIVEAVTGKSWQTNVAERIAQPLGLSDVFYAGDAAGAEHLVDGWVHTEDGWVGALQFTDPSVGWGYGALTATNRDLARFGRALFDGDLFASDETLSKVLDFTAEMDPSVLAEGEPANRRTRRVTLPPTRFAAHFFCELYSLETSSSVSSRENIM